MKLRFFFLPFLLFAVCLSGCATLDAQLPDGKAVKLRYVRTGKFSSTTIEATNFAKAGGHVTADQWTVKHSNAWIPNIEIQAEGYERVVVSAK